MPEKSPHESDKHFSHILEDFQFLRLVFHCFSTRKPNSSCFRATSFVNGKKRHWFSDSNSNSYQPFQVQPQLQTQRQPELQPKPSIIMIIIIGTKPKKRPGLRIGILSSSPQTPGGSQCPLQFAKPPGNRISEQQPPFPLTLAQKHILRKVPEGRLHHVKVAAAHAVHECGQEVGRQTAAVEKKKQNKMRDFKTAKK